MFQEYEEFILTSELDDESVPVGTAGVILMVLGGSPSAYEVEFPDGKGGNLGNEMTYTLTEDSMGKQNDTSH